MNKNTYNAGSSGGGLYDKNGSGGRIESDERHEKENQDLYQDEDLKISDYSIIEEYSQQIRAYMESNDFGAIRTDKQGLTRYYREEKSKQCKDFEAEFDVEETFMYGFGAAICRAAEEETRGYVGSPDVEGLIEDVLEREDEEYYLDEKSLSMKKGAYHWSKYLERTHNR